MVSHVVYCRGRIVETGVPIAMAIMTLYSGRYRIGPSSEYDEDSLIMVSVMLHRKSCRCVTAIAATKTTMTMIMIETMITMKKVMMMMTMMMVVVVMMLMMMVMMTIVLLPLN